MIWILLDSILSCFFRNDKVKPQNNVNDIIEKLDEMADHELEKIMKRYNKRCC